MSAAQRKISPPSGWDEPPPPPDDLDERGRAIYSEISVRLHDRLLWSNSDYTRVGMYCSSLAAALKLDEKLARKGVRTNRGRLRSRAALEWKFARRWAAMLGLPEPERLDVPRSKLSRTQARRCAST